MWTLVLVWLDFNLFQIDDEDEYSWPALADETIDEVKTNYTSISPIMQAPQSMEEPPRQTKRKPVARLQRPSQGYLPYIHNSLFQ